LLALFFAGAGFLGFYFLRIGTTLSVIFSICLGGLPFLYLYIKKNQRMKKFQAQLPESLDLMARSLRAGHAFSTGMKMAADEFDDPFPTGGMQGLEFFCDCRDFAAGNRRKPCTDYGEYCLSHPRKI
jgi:Flp pilus assembly protein TadB